MTACMGWRCIWAWGGIEKMLSEEEKSEIRVSYRQAAKPRRQIAILAQLYAVSKEDILEALGLPPDTKKQFADDVGSTGSGRSWPPEVRRAVIGRVLAGMTVERAGRPYGVPVSTVDGWMSRYRREHPEQRGKRK